MIVPNEKILEAKEKLGEQAAFIIANDLKLENFDEKNLKGCCAFHEESTPSFIWNPKQNCFKCFGCGKVYGILDHYISFYNLTFLGAVEKLFEETKIQHRFGERGVKTNREYKYPQYEEFENREQVEKYFASRKISKETLDYCDVRQSIEGLVIWNFFDENDVLLTVKCRHARKPKRNEQKEWFLPDYDNTPILYNMNKIDPTQPLAITEGQCDTLAIIESGYKNVVSVPSGTENMKWIETCFDWLEQFKKIIIWSDSDAPGIKMRREICARLGTWRCFFVDLPPEITTEDGKKIKAKDANEILYYLGKQAVLDYINNAQEFPVNGVDNLAKIDDFDIETASGHYTRLKELDNIVYKFLFGSVVLVTGQRGGGKSSFINQAFVCESLQGGSDCFVFSGEISASILKSWIELVMAGSEKIKMKNEFIHVIDPETKKQMRDWYNNRIWVYNETSNKVEDILDKAINVTRKYGVRTWILDNLMTMDIGADGTNILLKQKELIVRLTGLAKLYNVLIVLIAHPKKIQSGYSLVADDVSGSSDLTNLASYVLAVHRYTQKEKEGEKDGRGNFKRGKEPIEFDVSIEVMKNRFTGKLGTAQLYFDYSSYRFYRTNSELAFRYKWNKDTSPLPKIENKNSPDWIQD